ncbi:hypothetical protein FRC10_005452, partial [Ceratobasidium sp. 414]
MSDYEIDPDLYDEDTRSVVSYGQGGGDREPPQYHDRHVDHRHRGGNPCYNDRPRPRSQNRSGGLMALAHTITLAHLNISQGPQYARPYLGQAQYRGCGGYRSRGHFRAPGHGDEFPVRSKAHHRARQANGPGSPAPNPRRTVNAEWVRPPVAPHQDDPLPQNVLGRTMRELVDHSRRTLERVDEATTAIGDLRVQVGLTQIHLDGMFNWMLEATIRLARENTNLPGWEAPSPVLEAQDAYSAVPTPSDLSDPADTVSAEELLRSIKRLWLEMDLAGPVDGAGRMSVLRRYGELKELLDYYLGFLTRALANPGPDSLIVPGPVGRAPVMAYDVVREATFLLEWLNKGRQGPDSTGP